MKVAPLLLALPALSACGSGADSPVEPQRISLEDARAKVVEPAVSPDTEGARWAVSRNGQSIDFGRDGAAPWLTLECRLREQPAQLAIVRHAPSRPGQKALFPVLGNGMVSRFKADAALESGEWRWQAVLPASDPMLDVFTGPLELQATLPGGGSLLIEGSRIPGEFVNWCRAGGRVQRAEAAEAAEQAEAEASSLPPAR